MSRFAGGPNGGAPPLPPDPGPPPEPDAPPAADPPAPPDPAPAPPPTPAAAQIESLQGSDLVGSSSPPQAARIAGKAQRPRTAQSSEPVIFRARFPPTA